ncbi:MAG: hypothetical protein FWE37_02920 [Spirochaetaceae bacterium]|nr:hypothetical protein [Spirochaetaceae bacterium]
MNYYLSILTLILTAAACSRSGPSPEEAAASYLEQLFSFNFYDINNVATGEALITAALLQGRLANHAADVSHFNGAHIALTSVTIDDDLAKVGFILTFANGTTLVNNLILINQTEQVTRGWVRARTQSIHRGWQAYYFEHNILPPLQLFNTER